MNAPDRAHDEHRSLGEILHQVGAGVDDLLLAVPGALEPLAGIDEQGAHLGIQTAEFVPEMLVADHHPASAGVVAARGCLLGEIDALEDQLIAHRPIEVKSLANRSGGGEEAIDLIQIEACRGHSFCHPMTIRRWSKGTARPFTTQN